MTEPEFKNWVKDQQGILETIILEAAKKYVARYEHLPNFKYDFAASQAEAYNLMNGVDLCYDRLTTPLAYSLWYQARRINVFLSNFSNKIVEALSTGYPIDIFDLGAGTGCVQLGFGLAYVAFKRRGLNPLFFKLINVDLSPFMLEYLRSYLWPAAVAHYPELKDLPIEYHVYSWSNKSDFKVVNPWIVASYLFDSSDNEDYLTSTFEELIQAFDPEKLMLLTSSQSKKVSLMESLVTQMKSLGYQAMPTGLNSVIFDGALTEVDMYRKELIRRYSLPASLHAVSWKDRSFNAVGLEKGQTGLFLNTKEVPQHLALFNPPLKVRREVLLTEDQQKAAAFDTRPVIIAGPAGCGKSVVITEKIMNILDHFQWSENLSILVSTFNKGLIKQLRAWVTDLLKVRKADLRQIYYSTSNGVDDGTGEIVIGQQFVIRIKFIHFEMLGKYVGKITNTPFNEDTHVEFLKRVINEVRLDLNIASDDMLDILNPEFLLEEYHRVIYGLSCKLSDGEQTYQTLERKGRGGKPQLKYDSPRRKAIWQVLFRYGVWMHRIPQAGRSFTARRQLFLNLLEGDHFKDKFDYVFVDEFQDCTAADYRIMSLLLKDVNNLVLAGDLAQAVHIGQSGTIPRDDNMSRRVYHKLRGSYRLPYRISEAICPLSQQITSASGDKDVTVEMTPYKGAPPGARPIIVFASDNSQLAQKIVHIKEVYSIFDLHKITILEKDDLLYRSLIDQGQNVETTTVLRLKGLEKEFILWSVQAGILYENEVREFAYTIMTRTNCLLVIAITPECKIYNIDLVNLLRKDRLIYWDQETEDFLRSSFR
jgi:DNA helicase II / ATP-dependent DNA helicase PcrA